MFQKIKNNALAFPLFILLIVFLGYFAFQMKSYLYGPKISVKDLKEWSETDSNFFEVSGTVKNISSFNFNGRKVFTDKEGNFNENLILARGLNYLKFSAEDRFGNSEEKMYYVVLKRGELIFKH